MLDFVNRSLVHLKSQEKNYESIRSRNKVIKNIPFNSTTKKMTVVVELEAERRVRVYTKGASENIIDDCSHILERGG